MRNMFLTLRTLLSRTVLHPWKAGLFPAGVQLGTIDGTEAGGVGKAGSETKAWTREDGQGLLWHHRGFAR